MRKASEERKEFLKSEVERIMVQEERLKQYRAGLQADLAAEDVALGVATIQLAKLDSLLPRGAVGSWALETSAACGCPGACNCIKVMEIELYGVHTEFIIGRKSQ